MAALAVGGVWMCCVLKAVRAAWRAAATTGVVTWVPGPGPGPGSGLGAGRWDARWRYRCMGCLEGAGGSAMMGHKPSRHWTACRDWGGKRWYLAGAKTWPRGATNQSQQMAIRSSHSAPRFRGGVPSAKQIWVLGPAPTHVTACERRVGPGPNATSTLSVIQPTTNTPTLLPWTVDSLGPIVTTTDLPEKHRYLDGRSNLEAPLPPP